MQGAMNGGHAHHHGHHHHHGHSIDPADARWMIGIGLNATFVIFEVAAGIIGNSMALLADAGHNITDVLSLGLAAAAAWLARQTPSPQRTYGFGKATVLAALINSLVLVFACGFIASEAIARFSEPSHPASLLMISMAAAGVVVNGLTALLFNRGRSKDVNVASAFWHMAADAAISVGVVIAGVLIMLTGQSWIDPAAGLLFLVAILAGSWGVLKEAFDLSMDTAPSRIDVGAVRAYLQGLPGVSEVHDLHVWPLSTTVTALTAHLVRAEGSDDAFLKAACQDLHDRFGVGHSTLQVEVASLVGCEELHA